MSIWALKAFLVPLPVTVLCDKATRLVPSITPALHGNLAGLSKDFLAHAGEPMPFVLLRETSAMGLPHWVDKFAAQIGHIAIQIELPAQVDASKIELLTIPSPCIPQINSSVYPTGIDLLIHESPLLLGGRTIAEHAKSSCTSTNGGFDC